MKAHALLRRSASHPGGTSSPGAAPAPLAGAAEVRQILHGPRPVLQREQPGETLRRVCDCSQMGRDPTPAEQASMAGTFPRLQAGDWCVTGPPTSAYNCYAWSVGRSDRFFRGTDVDREFGDHDGSFEVSDFDAFGRAHGYLPASSPRDIALFVAASGEPQHAARLTRYRCEGRALYESKLGEDFRIAHPLSELEGGMYGDVRRGYVRGVREEYLPWLMAPRVRRPL